MSVENLASVDSGLAGILGDCLPECCFYCGKPLTGLSAFWHGLDGGTAIALHPVCGVAFGARVIRDALNAKYLSEDGRANHGIAPGAHSDENSPR